jgi:hypothetical protein
MMIGRRKQVAARLLERLFPGQDHEALLGDLNEESQRGRSRLWYFAQIVAAIVVGSWKDSRAHWVLALRAIAVGVAVLAMAGLLRLWDRLAYFQVELIYGLSNRPHHWLGIVGPHTLVFSGLMSVVLFAASGWVIARQDRAHGIALVVPFTAVMAALALTDFLRQTPLMPGWTRNGVFMLLLGGATSVASLIGILLGGYLATRPTERV